MPGNRITRLGWLAIGLAVVGSLVAIVNEIVSYRRSGVVDWGDVALAVGVPALVYAIVGARGRGSNEAPDKSGDAN